MWLLFPNVVVVVVVVVTAECFVKKISIIFYEFNEFD